ncbi:MAG: ATP-binding protein, partial [Deltaproteobacteria bacterium]|nr:ATP-binding protein [Deltaproteobacteria bacterium]
MSKAIGHEMCRRGHDVLFKKTYKLLNKLSSISATPRFERF